MASDDYDQPPYEEPPEIVTIELVLNDEQFQEKLAATVERMNQAFAAASEANRPVMEAFVQACDRVDALVTRVGSLLTKVLEPENQEKLAKLANDLSRALKPLAQLDDPDAKP